MKNVDPLSVSLNVASQTASSVTLNASVSDPSRVQEYYYSCGYTWGADTTDSSYTCSNLSINTSLPFQVRVVDRLGGGSLHFRYFNSNFTRSYQACYYNQYNRLGF